MLATATRMVNGHGEPFACAGNRSILSDAAGVDVALLGWTEFVAVPVSSAELGSACLPMVMSPPQQVPRPELAGPQTHRSTEGNAHGSRCWLRTRICEIRHLPFEQPWSKVPSS